MEPSAEPAAPQPEREYDAHVFVTLETAGQKFTSGVGPIPSEQGWNLFRAFLRDLHNVKPRKPKPAEPAPVPDSTGHP